MTPDELTDRAKTTALAHGADLAGVVKVADLPGHAENISRILTGAKCVLVTAAKHSIAAIGSLNNQVAQFDTLHTYDACQRSAHMTARFLESEGFPSVAIPAFIPIDMEKPKYGMRGEICWRRAGVRAGLGSYGENGLLVTPEFGSAVRISGIITTADLTADSPLKEDACDHCMRCLEACPAEALSGKGKINKKLCGDVIFRFGFRFFQRFMLDMVRKDTGQAEEIIGGHGLIELWQTFMTGNYYYCFKCQSQCPSKNLPVNRAGRSVP